MTLDEQKNYFGAELLLEIYSQWEKGLLSRVTANKKIFETAKRIAKRAEEQYRLAKKAEARSLQVEAEMKK